MIGLSRIRLYGFYFFNHLEFILFACPYRSNGMDNPSWPTDNRRLRKDFGRKKEKRITKEKEPIRDYPCLQHESLNALTLSSNKGRLEWTTVAGSSKGTIIYLGAFVQPDTICREETCAIRGCYRDISSDASFTPANTKNLSI